MSLWVQGFGCRVVSGLSSVVVGVSSLGSRDLLVVGESTLGFGALSASPASTSALAAIRNPGGALNASLSQALASRPALSCDAFESP